MRWENGYPTIQGASDAEDSSHLGGILVLTEHPLAPDMRLYYNPVKRKYQRNDKPKYDISGDQGILIMCGLLKQGHNDLVRTEFIDGKDWIRPSTHGIESIARGKKPTWIQQKWFEQELKFDGESIEEPFQNMAKAIAYGQLKLWTEINPIWDVAVLNYLRGGKNKWRGEPELAEWVIKYVEKKIRQ